MNFIELLDDLTRIISLVKTAGNVAKPLHDYLNRKPLI